MLRGVSPAHRAVIEEVQPYLGPHLHRQIRVALAWLVLLSNIDKHRFMHPTLAVRREGEATAEILPDSTPRSGVEIVWTAGPLYDGAELMRWRVTTANSEVKMGGQITFAIAFGERRVDLNLLDAVRERVGQVVQRFAPDFRQ